MRHDVGQSASFTSRISFLSEAPAQTRERSSGAVSDAGDDLRRPFMRGRWVAGRTAPGIATLGDEAVLEVQDTAVPLAAASERHRRGGTAGGAVEFFVRWR